jgi:hypothetical protein
MAQFFNSKPIMKVFHSLMILIAVLSVISFSSCKKDSLYKDGDAKLGFSTDTLTFDTVFVTLGSTTKSFTVRNPYNRVLNISDIRLAEGVNSSYRLNIDGEPVNATTNLEIPAKDSIYIFVEVTVDPSQGNLPFLLEDAVLFTTNGNQQKVVLQAYGQNAIFFNNETIESQTWENNLPYVILNSLEVAEGHTLVIKEGVKVYFGGNSGLFVRGSLQVEGRTDSMVTFRTYRLDKLVTDVAYDELPGQWLGVFLLRGSAFNRIESLDMRGSRFGLNIGNTETDQITNVSINNAPDLFIKNSIIRNASIYGLFSFLGKVTAENLLIYNVGINPINLTLGGEFDFRHCTFFTRASGYFDHRDPVMYLSNYNIYDKTKPTLKADFSGKFTNCIIYGALEDEILPDAIEGTGFAINFENCLVKIKGDLPTNIFTNCINNTDPRFVDVSKSDYKLADESPCINAGVPADIFEDLEGKPRDGQPDIGAYEK